MVQKQLFSSATDEWETPQDLFDKLNSVFHFTLDVCASDENHKCAKYFTREQDGLKQSWGGCYLVQPAIRQDDWRMGKEMFGNRKRHCGGFSASANRYAMVA